MPIKTISAREFHQDTASATRAAKKGPVIVTNRGLPSLVLMSFEEFKSRECIGIEEPPQGKSIVELLAMPEGTPAFDFDFEFPRLEFHPRPVDFD